jgi:putative tryptophan/tyrosine transport system substrate-binding protein
MASRPVSPRALLAEPLRSDPVIDRRTFLAGTGAVLLAAPLVAEAQPQTARVHKIGLLPADFTSAERRQQAAKAKPQSRQQVYGTLSTPRAEELVSALKFVGPAGDYIQVEVVPVTANRPLTIEVEATNLVGRGVEIIVAVGTPATIAASRATKTLPIVMVGVADPVGEGLVQSLPKPGGNITGMSLLGPELLMKSVDLVVAAVPKATRIGVMWNPSNPGAALSVSQTGTTLWRLGGTLVPLEVSQSEHLQAVLTSIASLRLHALLVVGDSLFTKNSTNIITVATAAKLPTMFQSRDWVDAGGLMAYEPDFSELIRDTSMYVARILRGAKPADLPVEQPRRFQFIVNRKAATKLSLVIPPSVLGRADEVIE